MKRVMRNLIGCVVIGVLGSIIGGATVLLADNAESIGGGDYGETVLVKNSEPMATVYISWKRNTNYNLRVDRTLKAEERYINQARHQMETDFNYHIKMMSGTELKIIESDDPAEVKAPAIVLGELAVRMGAKPAASTVTHESFRVVSKNGIVLIGGESDIGAMYGMYEVLNKLGCDWVMPGELGESIPEKKTIVIPDMDVEESPSFFIRSPWYSGGSSVITGEEFKDFDIWKMRHKNQPSYIHHGGFHPLQMRGGHMWNSLVKKFKSEFDKNPDMLALVRQPDGTMKRQGPQVETTNPEVIELFRKHLISIFEKNGWAKDKTVCISVGPADGAGFSESPESTLAGSGRIDPIYGGPDITDLQILLCNTLLESMTNEYPNLYLGFYLYNLHHDYPMRYKPHPHVEIVVADISYSRFHSTFENGIISRTYYKSIVEQWALLHKEQGNPMMFRGYNFDLAECLLPYTKLKMWGEDIPFYKKAGCFGTYNEWNKNWSNTGPSDYLEVMLNWDTSLNWRDVLSRYCKHAFGKGAPFMEEYYCKLVDKQSSSKIEAGSYHGFHLMYGKKFIKNSNRLFDKALAAAESPAKKNFISYYREPLEMLELYLRYRKAFTHYDFTEAKELYEKMFNLWKKYYKINSNLVGKSGPVYLKRFQKEFIEQGLKYSTGEYEIVEKIPEKLRTMLDPYVKGQELGFQSMEIDDSRFIKTSTWNIPWSSQGLGGYMHGAIWYRVPLHISKSLKGKAVGLFLGGIDNIARVYLNGEYIGTGSGFSVPMVFDLTDNIKYGGRNLLVIQIQHTSISEIGTFGIVYPSFVFTGPRLKQKAPAVKRLRRVLPGGALGDYE